MRRARHSMDISGSLPLSINIFPHLFPRCKNFLSPNQDKRLKMQMSEIIKKLSHDKGYQLITMYKWNDNRIISLWNYGKGSEDQVYYQNIHGFMWREWWQQDTKEEFTNVSRWPYFLSSTQNEKLYWGNPVSHRSIYFLKICIILCFILF